MVIRAIVINGMLQPIDPLPRELTDGSEVDLELLNDDSVPSPERKVEIEAWCARMAALDAPDMDDQLHLQNLLDVQRSVGKQEVMRLDAKN